MSPPGDGLRLGKAGRMDRIAVAEDKSPLAMDNLACLAGTFPVDAGICGEACNERFN